MSQNNRYLNSMLAVVFLIGAVTACSEYPSGAENPEPPSIPTIATVAPDLTYFGETPIPSKADIQNDHAYKVARQFIGGVQLKFGASQFVADFFERARETEPAFENGKWIWRYSKTENSVMLDVEHVAATVNGSAGEIDWEIYIQTASGEGLYEDYRIMEGTTSQNGQNGMWFIYSALQKESPDLYQSLEWDIAGEDDLTATFRSYYSDSEDEYEYARDGTRHALIAGGTEYNHTVELYWNTESDQGYWMNSESKLCWDSGKTDAPCSEIGF